MREGFRLICLPVLILMISAAASFGEGEPAVLVDIGKGDLPVVIVAPHGGLLDIPGGKEKPKGAKVRDVDVEVLAKKMVEHLEKRLDGRPHFVIAHFSRKFVDANRGPEFLEDEAYGDEVSGKQYEIFHGAIREAVDSIRREHGKGLLIDLHGQSQFPDTIIRGTVNGLTVADLLKREGVDALIGPKSVFGRIAAEGIKVEPPVEGASGSPEDEVYFIGGYIVRAYGSHNPDGIDSIQIEVGKQYRGGETLDGTARLLAEAVAIHLESYLKVGGSLK